jgi:hypothetical protein
MPPQQAYGLLDVVDERRGFGAHFLSFGFVKMSSGAGF